MHGFKGQHSKKLEGTATRKAPLVDRLTILGKDHTEVVRIGVKGEEEIMSKTTEILEDQIIISIETETNKITDITTEDNIIAIVEVKITTMTDDITIMAGNTTDSITIMTDNTTIKDQINTTTEIKIDTMDSNSSYSHRHSIATVPQILNNS